MIHCFPVKSKYLKMIAEGKKKVEVHIYKPYFRRFKIGDLLIMFDGFGNIVRAEVKRKRVYDSLLDLLKNEEAEEILPGDDESNILKEFSKIYGIPVDKLVKKKFVAIEIAIIDFIKAPEKR